MTLTQQIHAQLIAEGKMRTAPRFTRDQLLGRDTRRRLASGLRRTSWEGPLANRPGEFRVTALVPHCDTPELLKLCLGFLKRQTEVPYIMVVDSGSTDAKLPELLALRDDGVEIHQVNCHGTDHPVSAVAYAMDLGLAACRSEFLWCLHSDCFVTNRKMLAELLAKAGAPAAGRHAAIGYRTMPKPDECGECRNMVSHTCTLLHVPTLDDFDVTWSMRRLRRHAENAGRQVHIDTEMALNYRLLDRGVVPLILGDETFDEIETDANRVHLRAATARRIYLAPNRDDTAIVERLRKLLADDGDALPEQAPGGGAGGRRSGGEPMQNTAAESPPLPSPSAPLPACPSVSIIVAARNYGHFLRQCLRSCLKQTSRPLEVIYSDDASDDDSVAIARGIEGVTVVRAPRCEGVVAARNRGVAASRGEVFVHVDGDDV
ncbi:MAG TPA: glycosyltransferase family A protein, partial [Pirellulales bacterium]|nr:glycosyltransferase family A protein [Pirellulales bacterium]